MEEVKKNKKKNKVASLLLALALILTCGVAGTIAQYQRTFSGNSAANVAKFEVGVTHQGTDTQSIFTDIFKTVKDTNGGQEDHVRPEKIAPGTTGAYEIKLSNKSDVTVKYKLTAELASGGVYAVNPTTALNNKKIPLQFTLADTGTEVSSISDDLWTDIDDLTTGNSALMSDDDEIAIDGQDVNKTLYWRWKYTNGVANSTEYNERNTLDTAIGEILQSPNTDTVNISNDYKLTYTDGGQQYTATFTEPTVKISVTFTQVD